MLPFLSAASEVEAGLSAEDAPPVMMPLTVIVPSGPASKAAG